MDTSRDQRGILLKNKHSPYHSIVRDTLIERIPEGAQSILDVGCGSGATIRALKDSGCRQVCGIEVEPVQAELARKHGDKILTFDLNLLVTKDIDYLKGEFRGIYFDAILIGDCLEHLPFPNVALLHLRELLYPNGVIVASVPNIGFMGACIKIANQSFEYDMNGIFDITHFRFFCRSDIRSLFVGTGFDVVKIEALLPQKDVPEWFEGMDLRIENWTVHDVSREHYDQLRAYQWCVVARKIPLSGGPPNQRTT